MTKDDGPSEKLREWSSLIGIVTAIIGNVLISFALNIQRYAHIRLRREGRQRTSTWSGKRKTDTSKGYGTQQQDNIAEERARLNLSRPYSDRADRTDSAKQPSTNTREGAALKNGAEDQDPAISLHSRRRSASDDGEDSEKDGYEDAQKSYLKSPYWWLGLVFMTVGEAGNFLAYGFAPASTVSPLGVVALISNCIIAPCLLKEQFRQRDFWGVVVAIAGAVIIVFSANNSETKMGPQDIWTAITRWEFETYLGITAALIIILMWASGRYGSQSILIDLGLVGLFGGYTALTTKGVASLLSDTLWRTLTFPITYLLLFILVATALMQIRYVNRALQRFDSTQVIPTQFVLFTISVIVGSAVLYRDFQSATKQDMGKFVGGCLLTFLGVYLITSGRRRTPDYENDGGFEVADGPINLVDEENYLDEVDSPTGKKAARRISGSGPPESVDGLTSRRPSEQLESHPDSPLQSRSPLTSQSSSAMQQPQSSEPLSDISPLTNPWVQPDDDHPTRPPRLESTISSPILPSETYRLNPPTPPNGTAVPDGSPLIQSPTQPETPSARNRPSTLSRRSIAHLTPGPYMSPLSSPLSAVVADSIRRGQESSSSRNRRPHLSALHPFRSQYGVAASSDDLPTVSTPLRGSETGERASGEEAPEESAGRSRARSLSTTLGDFFRFRRDSSRGKRSQGQADHREREETS